MRAPAAVVSKIIVRPRRLLGRRSVLLAFLLAAATTLLVGQAAFGFSQRLGSTVERAGPVAAAVVFTGQFDRVYTGLALLEAGRVERLLISGVNRGAGIEKAGFARQFRLSAALVAALESGRLQLGTVAQNTRENAIETACWVSREKIAGQLLLITSESHMPRASRALEHALPDRLIQRLAIANATGRPPFGMMALEFTKYLIGSIVDLQRWYSDAAGRRWCGEDQLTPRA